jgi:hypothetical protein
MLHEERPSLRYPHGNVEQKTRKQSPHPFTSSLAICTICLIVESQLAVKLQLFAQKPFGFTQLLSHLLILLLELLIGYVLLEWVLQFPRKLTLLAQGAYAFQKSQHGGNEALTTGH